jgi:predicted aspartyl protease
LGITNAILKVKEHRKAEKSAEVNFLVDSGAVYSLVPGKILDELDIEPHRNMIFSLADGSKMERKVCIAYFEYEGEGGSAPVGYGEEGDEPLLGATTSASLGLVLNPFTRTLHPMRMLMGKLTTMKIWLSILFFTVAVVGQAQPTPEDKLVETVKQLHQALVNKNMVAINQQTDKALSYGHSNGWIESKKQLMANLASGYSSYQKYSEDSVVAVINANLAHVRYKASIDAALNGNKHHFELYVLEVWVRKGNRWLLFARQSTKAS